MEVGIDKSVPFFCTAGFQSTAGQEVELSFRPSEKGDRFIF